MLRFYGENGTNEVRCGRNLKATEIGAGLEFAIVFHAAGLLEEFRRPFLSGAEPGTGADAQ